MISPRLTMLPTSPVASEVIFLVILRDGAVLSTTVTSCEVDATLPESSVAIQLTIVPPMEKRDGALFARATCCISVTNGKPISIILVLVEVASKTIFSGGIISGAVVSTIDTCCCAVIVFPEASAAIHVTVVLPNLKNSGESFVIDIISPLSMTDASPR